MTEGQDKIGVFVVEDHEVVRRLLGKLIERMPDLSYFGGVATAEEALEQIQVLQPRLVLVDVSLPGMSGIHLISEIKECYPQVLTLAVSGHDEMLYAESSFKAGARGYVMKGRVTEVVEAIRTVCKGGDFFSEQVRDQLDKPE